MRICHRQRLVFLSNPRTASTSVGRALEAIADVRSVHITQVTAGHPFYHHIPAVELKAIFEQRGWAWDSYRRFCVVRNPFDRVVSLYHLLRRFSPHGRRGWWFNLRRALLHRWRRPRDFRSFVLGLDPRRHAGLLLSDFICDAQGNRLVPDLLRFETLEQEVPAYLHKLGIEMPGGLPRANVSSDRYAYRDYYDAQTRARIESLFQYELQLLDYRF